MISLMCFNLLIEYLIEKNKKKIGKCLFLISYSQLESTSILV